MTSSDLAHLTAAWSDLDQSGLVHIEAGEVLITEGENADSVYLLLGGSLEVSRVVNGVPTVLATVDRPGSLVGEMVTLGGGTRTATVTAMVATDLISTTSSSFKTFLETHSNLANELVAIAGAYALDDHSLDARA